MRRDHRTVALAAVLGGLLLGFLDLLWIKWVPYPLAELGNSTATWAVAAFAFGYWVRSGRVRAAAGGAVLLVVAVAGYRLAATLVQGDDLTALGAPASLLWMALGVLAGVVFGVGGAWARTTGWRQIGGIALPASVFFEEAARFARKAQDPNYPPGLLWNVAIDVALGVLLVMVIGRSTRQRLLALAAALPLAVIIFVGFAVAGGR